MKTFTKTQRLKMFLMNHPQFSFEPKVVPKSVRKLKGEWKSESLRKWVQNNPLKRAAHRTVFVAKRNGTLIQKPCRVCGEKKSEAHHTNYNEPLKVMWLCKKHHAIADKRLRELTG